MKLKVVIADDEPSALNALKYVIETYFNNFEVVYCAQNGREALERTKLLQPDILIADIKMPLIDGIDLAEKVKQSCPTTCTIVISGYQEFEYARAALRSGVEDYLLKPIDVDKLGSILDKLYERKLVDYYYRQIDIFNRYIYKYIHSDNHDDFEDSDVKRYLPFEEYTGALVRTNCLPSRFSVKNMSFLFELNQDKKNLIDLKEFEGLWLINGRDTNEFFIFRAEGSKAPSIKEFFAIMLERLSIKYYTVAFAHEPFRFSELNSISKRLWRTLDNRLVLGTNQLIHLGEEEINTVQDPPILDSILENKIKYLISAGMHDDLKRELAKLFKRWESEKRPQLWVENNISQIISIITRCVCPDYNSMEEIDFLLDEAFSSSATYDDLLNKIWKIITDIVFRNRKKEDLKVDTKEFFKSIEKYIQQNLHEPLSLELVCSHIGISQTYLSRLFRKYTNMTFNEYITIQRIERAKKLMQSVGNEGMSIQDIALAVGYNTPSYFSKVFRKIVGVTPSEYMSIDSYKRRHG